jgi:hypothetical protein
MVRLLLAVTLVLVIQTGVVADLTNTWSFNTATDYQVSSSNYIEVADGVAKLKLIADQKYRASVADYRANGTLQDLLRTGPDLSICLSKSGSLYKFPGVFTSRIIDGGVGNSWSAIAAKVYNIKLANAGNALVGTESGLVGLWHMDGSWVDSSSRSNNTSSLGATFSQSAVLGSGSGDFSAGDAATGSGIPLSSEMTIAFWAMSYYADNQVATMPITFNTGGTKHYSLRLGGTMNYVMTLNRAISLVDWAGDKGASTGPGSWTDADLNKWQHIVVTFKNGAVAVYKNAVLVPLVYNSLATTLPVMTQVRLGSYFGLYRFVGLMDEVSIFSRALTADEVYQLYSMPRSVMFRVRSGTSESTITNNIFVGPTGSSSYYLGNQDVLQQIDGGFRPWERYVQYRAYLYGPSSGTDTPYVDGVTFQGTGRDASDDTLGDFQTGEFTTNTTTYPSVYDTPYLGLTKGANGGYERGGTFTSRVFTNSILGDFWQRLYWTTLPELVVTSDSARLGLWHVNNDNWSDYSGNGNHGSPSGVQYSEFGKLGSHAAVFDGTTSYVTISTIASSVKTLEFWIRDNNVNDGIMGFTPSSYLVLSNRMVQPVGLPVDVAVYVNGSSTRRILSGWNHVALTSATGWSVANWTIGFANGDYMDGMLDEMAAYGRVMDLSEIKGHFVSGRQPHAGRVKFQVRGGDTLPLIGAFAGPGNSATDYYIESGAPIYQLPLVTSKYVQYRAYFLSDGDTTPTVDSITVTTINTNFVDNTLGTIGKGTFDNNTTRWCGDEVKLSDIASVPGLSNLKPVTGMEGLWDMDDSSWGLVTDSSGKARHGTARNGASLLSPGQVGTKCGTFDGVNDDISLPGIPLTTTFSVCAWFRSTASTRSAILSHATGDWVLEFNGDGVSTVSGVVTFSVGSGGTRRNCVAATRGLNDGRWHHVAGVREGDGIHIYVDGAAVGSTSLGGVIGTPSNDGALVAHHGILNTYFAGQVDEVAIFSTAISEAWLRQSIAMGFDAGEVGTFTSEWFDAGGAAIWEKIEWQANATFGNAMTSTGGVAGLWHLDYITNGNTVVDSSTNANNGTVAGAVVNGGGRFGACLSFNGSGNYVTIPGGALPSSAPLSVEAWVRLNDAGNRTIFDRRTVSAGYSLSTDSDGRLCFWVSGVTCRSVGGLRPNMWNHVAGVYDGKNIRVFINGDVAGCIPLAIATFSANSGRLGGSEGGYSGDLNGLLDEVVVHGRTLAAEEIRDQARAGFGALRFQVCVTNIPAPPSPVFIGPDGTSNTYFTVAGESMVGKIPLGRYFQFKAELFTADGFLEPRLQGFIVDQSRYPSDHPWIRPTSAQGTNFVGKILSFSHYMATNVDSAVRYQISGDNGTNWYWWSGMQWEPDGAGLGWLAANSAATVSNSIGTFYSQHYLARGGTFSFKAFLDSDGATPTALDWVQMVKSSGRVTVIEPNGQEVGQRAWLVGTPYDIRWSCTGVVGNVVMIDLSKDDGITPYRRLGTNVANNGHFTTYISEEPGTHYRIRVSDPTDDNISDWSDNSFELKALFHLSVPNGGEHWYCGRTNMVVWESPKSGGFTLEGPAWLWFSPNNGTTWHVVLSVSNYNGRNSYAWRTPSDNAELRAALPTMPLGYEYLLPSNLASIVSETALMGVSVPGASTPVDVNFYGDTSDATFTNAGIGITFPYENVGVRMGSPVTIAWTAAGAGNRGVTIEFFDGQTWALLSSNAPCGVGENTFDTVLRADRPSTVARIRIRANADTNIVGLSDLFTLADVNIVDPVGRGGSGNWSIWQLAARHNIRWTAAGAGDRVNIMYSVNSGGTWRPVALDHPNINSSGVLVTNVSSDWVIPGPPADKVRVRIQSTEQTNLYADTGDFDFSGVQVVRPNGTDLDGITWEFSQGGTISWQALSAGAQVSLMVAYEDNPQTRDYEVLIPGVTAAAGSWNILPQLLRRPSNFARIRIVAPNPPAEATEFQPMDDTSDTNFVIRGLSVVEPSLGDVLTMGRVAINGLQWYSAGAGSGVASVYYSSNNGQTFALDPFMAQILNEDDDRGTGRNIQNVTLPRTLTPSETARIKLVAGNYLAFSAPFVARGIRVTAPASGANIVLGTSSYRIQWQVAGLATNAVAAPEISFVGTNGSWQSGGLPGSVQVSSRELNWALDPDLLPTTNATIRFSVTSPSQDTDVVMYSDAFRLQGIKVVRPAQSETLELGTPAEVAIVSAGMGLDRTVVRYSADGGVNYDETVVTQQWALADGSNAFTWVVENSRDFTRMPSADARLRAVCGTATNVSKPFVVRGLKVTAPTRTDIWSSAETNTIRWVDVGIGGPYNLYLVHWNGTNRLGADLIASGRTGSSYDWAMTAGTVASNVSIEIVAGGRTSSSEMFEIVAQPTVRIVSPANGEFWKVGGTNVIRWSRGGSMSDQFAVVLSMAPYTESSTLYSGPCPLADGMFRFTWDPVTNTVGPARISVSNLLTVGVGATEDFNIAGRFDITPFGTENYALSTKAVNWVTHGTVQMVDLYYTTDPLKASGGWVKINSEPYAGNIGDRMPATPYPWQLPQIKTPIMYLRIQDHAYEQSFSPDRVGPFDDMGPFPVKYYTIVWHVLDASSSNHLESLSVSDSSGWSEANLASPVTHEYPYGIFDTVWFQEFFRDGVVFNWESKPSRTNTVWMQRSDSDKGIQVLADFAFNAYTNRMTIHAWTQRGGTLLTDPTRCDVTVYSSSGQTLMTMASTTPLSDAGKATGVFRIEWNNVTNVLAYGGTYFAKVAIVYSGQTYSSVVTYTLRLAVDMTVGQAIVDAIGTSQENVQSNITEVASNLNALAMAQSVFRSNAMDRLNTLTGGVASIQIGITNLNQSLTSFSNQALQSLAGIASNVSVILPAVTNIEGHVAGIETAVASTKSRILTRPDNMVFGTTNTILYKSTVGFGSGVSLTVSNSFGGGPAAQITAMGEVVAGLYQADLVANWGSNSYVITCADPVPQPGWDSIVVRVGAAPLTGNVALDQLLGDVARIEQRITNVTEMLNGLTNTTGMLQLLDSNVGHVEAQLTNILRTVTNMEVTVGTLTNLATAAAVLMGIDWSAVSNIGNLAASLTNIQSSVTNMQVSLNSVTNLSGAMATLAGIQVSISNLQTSVGSITNIGTVVATLTNVDWGAVSNVGGLSTSLTNIQGAIADLKMSIGGVSNFVVTLTNLPALASNVTNIQGSIAALQVSIGGLTNLEDAVSVLTNVDWGAISNIGSLAATLTDIKAGVTNMEASMGALTNLGSVIATIGSVDWSAVSNVGGMTAYLTNIQSTVSWLQGSLGGVSNYMVTLTNIPLMASNVTNIQGSVAELRVAMGALTNLSEAVASLTNVDWSAVSNVGGMSAALTNIQATLAGLPALASNITNIQVDIQGLQASVDALTNLSSLASTLGTVSNALLAINWADVLSIQTGVGDLSRQLGGVDWAQMAGLSATLNQALVALQGGAGAATATELAKVRTAVEKLGSTVPSGTSISAVGSQLKSVQQTLTALDRLESFMGSDSDSAGTATVFGRLASLESGVEKATGKGSDAVKKASSARNEAASAVNGIRGLKELLLHGGDEAGIASKVEQVRAGILQVQKVLAEIPAAKEVEALSGTVKNMAASIEEFSKSQGVKWLKDMKEPSKPGAEGKIDGALDKERVDELNGSILEIRGRLQFLQKMIEEWRDKPLVEETLIGG